MPTDVVMPQMGESIAEGTVSKWLKKAGDKVERDEPLLEISTDKVDAEIPSPVAGTLVEIVVQEGQTVAVNSVVARIATDGEAAAQPPASGQQAAAPASQTPPPPPPAPAGQAAANASTAQEIRQQAPAAQAPQSPKNEGLTPSPEAPSPKNEGLTPSRAQPPAAGSQVRIPQPSGTPPAWATQESEEEDDEKIASLDERRRTMSSPLVRRIARENNIDLSQVSGSGVSGRVTKNDILEFLQQPRAAASASAPAEAAGGPSPAAPQAPRPAPAFESGQDMRIEPLSVMRKRIAQHMVESKRTSAHVTTVFEADFSLVERLRRQNKEAYGERGVKLTYLPFIVQAAIAGLREFPILNASMDDNNVIYHRDHNIGIAVALEWGLIVPVVKHADEKNILGLARTVNDLGERARTKKLSPDEVQGGTFTITNPGIYGGLFGTPIINQPQVAILGVGGVKKRPVVVESESGDSIAIRPMCILALSFDHRLIDGAVADQFMARVRTALEKGPFTM